MPEGYTHASAEVGVVAPAPELYIYAYSSSMYGAWRTSYLMWTPVTVYYVSGHYYRQPMPRARAVVVYTRGSDFFFPPRERAWRGYDKRFDHSRAPTWSDHRRAKHKEHGRGRGRPDA